MTDKEQIERISKLLNELSLADITSTEFDEMFPKQSINDIKDEMWEMYCFVSDVCDTINMGDTTKQEQKTEWIPVSERLPDESGEYLVTYNGIATTLDYSDKYGWYYDDGEHFTQFEDDVIAWMPLPEPYKESPTRAESEEV